MSVSKRISAGDYNLTTLGAGANTIITTDTLKIYGNLYIQGNTSVVNVANINTADPTITLNSNVTLPFQGNSGIEVYRGNTATYYTPGLFWNETASAWQITTNIANPADYANISTVAGTGFVDSGTQNQLAYYKTNSTVGNVGPNLTWTSNTTLSVTGNLNVTNLSVNTANITSTSTVGGGGTGVYFTNGSTSGELASKAAAIKYGIIFG